MQIHLKDVDKGFDVAGDQLVARLRADRFGLAARPRERQTEGVVQGRVPRHRREPLAERALGLQFTPRLAP